MTYACPQCGLPRTGSQAVGLSIPQCICHWQFTPPPQTTGWPPGMLQDDSRGLSRWLASRPDARRIVRETLEILDNEEKAK